MTVIEIQRIQTADVPMTEILIGERLDDPYHRIHAAKLVRFRNELIVVHMPGLPQPATLADLQNYTALLLQVVATAEQFAAESTEQAT